MRQQVKIGHVTVAFNGVAESAVSPGAHRKSKFSWSLAAFGATADAGFLFEFWTFCRLDALSLHRLVASSTVSSYTLAVSLAAPPPCSLHPRLACPPPPLLSASATIPT
jgi:hypothetical protein